MPRRTPRYWLLVEDCRRKNRIADEKAEREAKERWEAEHGLAARQARAQAAIRELEEKYKK